MKKVILSVAVVAMLTLSLSGCKKSCECSRNGVSVNLNELTQSDDVTKDDCTTLDKLPLVDCSWQ